MRGRYKFFIKIWGNCLKFKVEPTPKSKKEKNATKTPIHETTQNNKNSKIAFRGILCFRVFVVK